MAPLDNDLERDIFDIPTSREDDDTRRTRLSRSSPTPRGLAARGCCLSGELATLSLLNEKSDSALQTTRQHRTTVAIELELNLQRNDSYVFAPASGILLPKYPNLQVKL